MSFAKWTLAILVTPTLALSQPGDKEKMPAPLFNRLGNHQHKVTTKSNLAQRYFNQGLILAYGFNHKEAVRSFQAVVKIDPECAMGYWGIAWALGPNINKPMAEAAVKPAWDALQKAVELAPKATLREQGYVQALEKRYAPKPMKDRSKLDRAFAEGMKKVVNVFPDDLDAATIYAEALMDTTPWNYWDEKSRPREATKEIVAQLERVLKANPQHPGANHYYIHAVEASSNPERGLGAALRLRHLVPDAGHLVHMPSHIYLRVGDYHEASLANERAIAADENYITQCRAQGFYPAMYYSHNVHFLWFSTSLEGRSEVSLRAAKKTAAVIPDKALTNIAFLQWLKASPWLGLVRYGKWDEMLKQKKPAGDLIFLDALWHYTRGYALTRKRMLDKATMELKALEKIAESDEAKKLDAPEFPGHQILQIAHRVLLAEVEGLKGNQEVRLAQLRKAVEMQDKIPYMEPPWWFFPNRQLLGRALLESGKFAEAERVYREDLKQHPNNGWSTFGLLQVLRAQGKPEALEMEQRLKEVWKHADLILTSSCF